VYLRLEPIAAGGSLAIPGNPLTIKALSWIALVDPEPAANWGHACRYLVIEQASGELTSIAARFPAFRPGDPLWEVLQRPV
jgi:ABC-type dipeptide/oligopeptide/nickel transport system permease subunit